MTNAAPAITNGIPDSADIALGKDILGIRGPVDIPTGWEWVIYALGSLLLLVLAVFLVKRLLRRATVIKPPPIPYVLPHTLALRKLETALRLIGDPYRFCVAVSDAIRGYVEGRFDIHAPDRTTDEFLEELRDSTALTPKQQDSLSGFLNQCDLVKFARVEPERPDLEYLHKLALGLVEETMPGTAPAESSNTSSAKEATA